MAAAATKFTESQLEALEKAYNEGLKSCKLGVNGQKIETLALECNLPREKVTTWINNRNRRARREATKNRERELPDDSSAEGPDLSADGNDGGSQQFKKAPIHRRLSAWNVFCSKVFREDLREAPKDLRIQMARDMYKKLSSEEKEKLELEAQSSKNAKKFSGEEIEKEISKSMQRIWREMQYMEQFGVVGYSLVMKPDGKLLNSSTMKGEEFLHSDFSISQKFSTFCDIPTEKKITRDDVRLFLNRQYSIAAGEPKRVPYKQYQKSFYVEGWPESVPFKTPARMGSNQLKAVMEQQAGIQFIITSSSSSSLPQVEAGEPSTDAPKSPLQPEGNSVEEEVLPKKRKFAVSSIVKKGDVVPVYAPLADDADDANPFWLFYCSGKSKPDHTINGKWLMLSEGRNKYILLPQKTSIYETNILIFNGERVVLSDCHFSERGDGSFVLTEATLSWLHDLSCEAPHS